MHLRNPRASYNRDYNWLLRPTGGSDVLKVFPLFRKHYQTHEAHAEGFYFTPPIIFAPLSFLPPSRNSDPGSHGRLLTPPREGDEIKKHSYYIMKEMLMKQGRPGDGHIRCTAVTTFQQFCRRKDCCCAVHLLTVLSSATPWARSREIYERCSLLFCYFHPR